MKGLVLEGGGARGAYQVGAYAALKEIGIEFDGVAGTSIGAVNAAYIVQGDIEIMKKVWLDYDYTHFMNIDEQLYEKVKDIWFSTKNFNNIIDLMYRAKNNEGIDIEPFRVLLEKTLDESVIRNSKKDFGLITVYWDRKLHPCRLLLDDIPEGRLVEYLIASCSLPIFQFNKIDDKLFLDGGLSDNIPVSLLKNNGYDDIVVIRLTDDIVGKINLSKHNDIAIKVIIPSEDLGGGLNKDHENVARIMKLGYLDAMKAYDRIDGVNYFFEKEDRYDEDYCFDMFRNLKTEVVEKLCDILMIRKEPNLRTLLENVIPKLGEHLGLEKKFSYRELYYSIYEKKLEYNSISRVNLYDFNKVVQIVGKNVDSDDGIVADFGIPIIQKNISLLSLNKNKGIKILVNCIIIGWTEYRD
ncbi:MAG: patatin-like phospholipase family protein [Clostridioides sp.]|jgi:NTE family protein|nr:patatin-like phospholipase family protein [Clostridioides sp.]